MTGVGYDLEDLSKSKFLPTNPKTIAKNKRKRAEQSQRELEMAAVEQVQDLEQERRENVSS
jgi:hypothetical protein